MAGLSFSALQLLWVVRRVPPFPVVYFCGHRLEAKFKPNGIGYIKKEERMEDFKGFLQTSVDHDVLNDFIESLDSVISIGTLLLHLLNL